MTADQFALSVPHDTAVYLPALNENYIRVADLPTPADRALPAGLTLADLAFWGGNSKLWTHKCLLHSVGGYRVGVDTRGSIFNKTAGEFVLVGDSGGFQIGTGTLQGVKGLTANMDGAAAVRAWAEDYDAKIWIIDWLERYCDYAMTIDMPLWAMTASGKASPFHRCNEQQLIDMTVENLRIIDAERRGRTKWLNVIQGTNAQNIQRWWDSVKWFRGGGWALAGAAGWRGGVKNVLATVLMMRDKAAFEKGMDWLHVLGMSQPTWDIVLTAIQRELRKINPLLQVSYDSATPMLKAGSKDEYILPIRLGPEVADWSFQYKTLETHRYHADAANPIPANLHSPIGQQLMMHHLAVNADEFAGRRLDNISTQILANHNIWVILDAARRANALAFGGHRDQLPRQYSQLLDLIEQLFAAKDWRALLDEHNSLLDAVAASRYNP